MPDSFDLSKLEPNTFEHLVNQLALRVLGAGHTGFSPGPDGGRDGYFEGKAPYPSNVDKWSGKWYIQSKFHKPHLSKDSQKWLLSQISNEIKTFKNPTSNRTVPNIWIVATNIEPSGTSKTGTFDKARSLVAKHFPKLAEKFHIWGGEKILNYLNLYPEVSGYYKHFLTPGHVLTELYDQIKDAQAEVKDIINFLIIKQFNEQQFTKLEQAGSDADNRPGIHKLFIDLPFITNKEHSFKDLVIKCLAKTALNNHTIDTKRPDAKEWTIWYRFPTRARVWFIKGGPGQGKSTIGQYFSQIQRAAYILKSDNIEVLPYQRTLAEEIKIAAETWEIWTENPRIPVSIELKDYAYWFSQKNQVEAHGILTYLAEKISIGVEQKVHVGTLKRALSKKSWFFVFDGLDEVPHDVKDNVAKQIKHFVDDIVLETKADVLSICTSRPQGYSGQFNDIDGPVINLLNLNQLQALRCAEPILRLGRTENEAQKSFEILRTAIQSSSVKELMTTPLQSHIMAVVVRDGGKPPERRWQLFTRFYEVIKRREANRNLPDIKLARLLREEEQLLKTVHNRLGFILHARAETSEGAITHLNRREFRDLLSQAVSQMIDNNIDETVETLMEATTERLVLVNTPDDGNHVRFDVRQLQEFFASEFLYDSISADELRDRIEILGGDSHWTEVMHFLLSALIENNRRTELTVAISVLDKLDSEDGPIYSRLLNRRLARGALLSGRLLQEGVLEQDKRLRNLFRKSIEPLMAITDLEALQLLIRTDQNNSLFWTIDILIDSLQTASHTENIGAAITLAYILPDSHTKTTEVKDFLLNSSIDYIHLVLKSRKPASPHEGSKISDIPASNWLIDTIIDLLLQTDSSVFIKDLFASCKSIIQKNINRFKTLVSERNLSKAESNILLLLFDEEKRITKGKPDFNLGILEGYHFDDDWIKRDKVKQFSEYYDNNVETRGVLKLFFSIFKFVNNYALDDLKNVLDYFESNKDLINILPSKITAYLPLNIYYPLQPQIDFLRSLNEEQFNDFRINQDLCPYILMRPVRSLTIGKNTSLEKWEKLVSFAPEIASELWSDDIWNGSLDRNRPNILDTSNAVQILIDKLIEHPEIFYSKPNLWSRIFSLKSKNVTKLRRLLLNVSHKDNNIEEVYYRTSSFAFHLNLPQESSLLPQITKLLFAETLGYEDGPNYGVKQSLVESFIPDLNNLKQIIHDESIKSEFRAAAILLLLMSKESEQTVEENDKLIVNLFISSECEWCLFYFAKIIVLSDLKRNKILKRVLGEILESIRNNIKITSYFNLVIKAFREESVSPVTFSNVQEQWLAK